MSQRKDYEWLNRDAKLFLSRGYLEEGETAEQRIKDIAHTAQAYLEQLWHKKNKYKFWKRKPEFIANFAKQFEYCMSRGWFSLSTPVWVNYGKKRGLPVSCFNSFCEDSCESITYTNAEIATMTQKGGGTSVYVGDLRPRGAKISSGGVSDGPVSFLDLFESTTNVMKQSSARRGSLAAYMPIEHPDIMEFLEIRMEGCPLQDILSGVTVGDEWFEEMKSGDRAKRKVWAKLMKTRAFAGVPYILFRDNANKNKPQVYKDKGMEIVSSNLCNEIMLPSSGKESFVCVLSSLNLLHYDEWKDTDAPEILLAFLDTVNEEFVIKTKDMPFMERAHHFAKRHRALGLGVLGWHSYLQKNMIPFGSFVAMGKTEEIFSLINRKTLEATKQLANWFGEPELLKGYGERNTTRCAIAPTKSSSFILGQVSQSIEPYHTNYFVDDKAKIQVVFKNPYLKEVLKRYDKDTQEVWDSIRDSSGSAQHLKFLTDEEREVFKTFGEISQMDIITQAGIRQKHVDQGQSLNIIIHPKCPAKDENVLYIAAHEKGVKGLYYRKSYNAASEFRRELVSCSSCEG
jgi:ribonucleoside-diphosphate reductase alpha chain